MSSHFVYLLRCADGSFYCGYSTDPEKRCATHNRGKGAKYTRARLPVTLCYVEACTDKTTALQREYALKQCSHAQKQTLAEEWKNKNG